MALEPVQDGVGVAVRSTEGKADEIELLGGTARTAARLSASWPVENISLV